MEIDDIFDTGMVGVFGSDLDTLVISAYKTAIDGIEKLNQKERARLSTYDLASRPELKCEINWWEEQHIPALKYHAGNMGLVSLIILFEDWLIKRYEQVFPSGRDNEWRARFEKLESHLHKGPLSLVRFEAIVDARNSIVHHRGQPKFNHNGKLRVVIDEFLDCFSGSGQERVAVSESLLLEICQNVKQHADLWFRRIEERRRCENKSTV